jgi:hypothetical protein
VRPLIFVGSTEWILPPGKRSVLPAKINNVALKLTRALRSCARCADARVGALAAQPWRYADARTRKIMSVRTSLFGATQIPRSLIRCRE